MKYKNFVRRSISCSHLLSDYVGACHNLHGHTFKVEVLVTADEILKPQNYVVDFKWIKEIIDSYDHQDLNEKLNISNPTAEMLAQIIYFRVKDQLRVNVEYVRVYESENCYVEVSE